MRLQQEVAFGSGSNCHEEEASLRKKKEELLNRISHKLDVLRAEQLSLKEEIDLNEELGAQVSD